MPDSSDVDAAIVAALLADAPLMALMPDGVFIDEAAPSLHRFVIVSLVDEHDEPMLGPVRAFEDATYLVKAVGLSTANPNMDAAAKRLDVILDHGALAVPGYTLMTLRRTSRVRSTEPDQFDLSIRWHHRGGRYQAVVCAA